MVTFGTLPNLTASGYPMKVSSLFSNSVDKLFPEYGIGYDGYGAPVLTEASGNVSALVRHSHNASY